MHTDAFIKRFNVWFLAPKSADEDKRRSEHILNIILVGSIAMLLFFAAMLFYYSSREGTAYHETPFGLFLIIPLFLALLLVFSRRGYFRAASYLLVLAYLGSNSYAAYEWGVDLHIVVLSYALIVLMASILIGTWFGFLVAGIITATIIPLRYLHLNGIVPLHVRADRVSDAVTLATVIFLIMVLAWLWNHEVAQSLARARKSEGELKEERDLLEIKVEERTQALRQAQFERIEQLYQFAEFGQLASGLFHDLLNLVNATALANDQQLRHAQQKKLAGVEAQVSIDRASAMSRRAEQFMLAVRRQLDHQETHEFFSLAENIEGVIQLLSYKAIKEKIRIEFCQKGDRIFLCFGNPFKFHQVVMNLVFNALEAYDGVPKNSVRDRIVRIRTGQKDASAFVSVEDKGSGIPENIQAKIFEPFFSTKTNEKGMGIGLATVKKIVEKDFHGGISVRSEEGKGSVFTVVFPIGEKDME